MQTIVQDLSFPRLMGSEGEMKAVEYIKNEFNRAKYRFKGRTL